MSGTLAVRTHQIADPGDLLARLPATDGMAMVTAGEGVIGWGVARRVELPRRSGRFAAAADVMDDLARSADVHDPLGERGSGLVAFLAGTFSPDSDAQSVLVVPEVLVGRRDGRAWLTTVGDTAAATPTAQVALPEPPRVRELGGGVDELAWLEMVAEAVSRIRAGELLKVVLARDVRVWATEPFDARALARRLAERFPSCHTFAVDGLVGASPELLVGRHGRQVRSRVLAGTAARGASAQADAELGAQLAASAKDRHEHDLAVASAREALAGTCTRLDVDAQPWLLRLANVQHLATDLAGELAEPTGVLRLVDALHPTAAVCGTPTAAALAALAAMEPLDRGRYAGPVGWVDAAGDGEIAIALRCAELAGHTARLFAGAGIMAESRPEAELEETRLKLDAMRTAVGEHPRRSRAAGAASP